MFGLLGKTLAHSFSKEIHEHFTKTPYTLFESDDLEEFFASTQFKGINVTIPYKNDVIKFLDELSEEADAIGSVNTIINDGGKRIGLNTDYYGLEKMLQRSHILVTNKDIIILGNGSTSRTIQYYCEKNSAKNIVILARNPKSNEYNVSDVENFKSTTIMFNATPVGMFPNNYDDTLFSLDCLPNLVSVVDVIYNPLRSSLLIEAEKRGIQAINGLFMLISQAVRAIEIFHNIKISDETIETYYKNMVLKYSNLVLIGMPMSGKSYFARLLSKKYNKDLVELDQEIERFTNMDIPTIFETQGESGFRMMEKDRTMYFSKRNNQAISCGGGIVLDEDNITALKQNGILLFLDMPLQMLQQCNPKSRPLLQNRKNLEKLYYSRYDLYQDCADIVILKDTYDSNRTMKKIEVKLDEYLNS